MSNSNSDKAATNAPPAVKNDEPPAAKRLRSQEADIIVAVGSGDGMKEFPCYRVILCSASDYFDTMLSMPMTENNSSRIEFPDKEPMEWKLVYSFMHPATAFFSRVSVDNVETLLPWFHEFQMQRFVEECDAVLSSEAHNISRQSKRNKIRRKDFDRVLALLSTCDVYDLPKTLSETWKVISDVFRYGRDIHGCFIITLKDVEKLAPFLQQEEQNAILLQAIDGVFPQDFAPKAHEMERETFISFVHAALRATVEKAKELEKAERLAMLKEAEKAIVKFGPTPTSICRVQ